MKNRPTKPSGRWSSKTLADMERKRKKALLKMTLKGGSKRTPPPVTLPPAPWEKKGKADD